MEEKDYNETLFDEQGQQPTRTCKVKEMKNGIAIKLEGYPLTFIRIIIDTRFHKYSILLRDVDGLALKLNKSEDRQAIAATIFKMNEEIRT